MGRPGRPVRSAALHWLSLRSNTLVCFTFIQFPSFWWRWLGAGWIEEGLAIGEGESETVPRQLSQSPGEGRDRNGKPRLRDKEERDRPDKVRVLDACRARQDARKRAGG